MEPTNQDSTLFYSPPESSGSEAEDEDEMTLLEVQQQLRAKRGQEMMLEEGGPSTSEVMQGDTSHGTGTVSQYGSDSWGPYARRFRT